MHRRTLLPLGMLTVTLFPDLLPYPAFPTFQSPPTLAAQEVDVWDRPVQSERSRTVDFLHYQVTLDVDLDRKVFQGQNRVTFTPFADGVERIELDAKEIVVEWALGPSGEALALERSDSSVVVVLPFPLSFGDTVGVTVGYRGEGSRGGSSSTTPLRTTPAWSPPIPGPTRRATGFHSTTTPTTR